MDSRFENLILNCNRPEGLARWTYSKKMNTRSD